ncbi:MAG TPA: PQQ-dependent sugar dehydrogenase [Gemmatimonadaceae bacterium]|nr:PQQ-dependent sugar dehydrogenase [Gemmatimonadaceae bacterium]
MRSLILPLVCAALANLNCSRGAADAARIIESGTAPDSLHVPAGFRLNLFARVSGARVLSVGPDGALYVSQTGRGQIARLVDVNGDGVADSQTVAVSGLNSPHGLAWRGTWLYIANTNAVVRVRIENGRAASTPEVLATLSSGGGHYTRSILFGADSGMYVAIGSSCNLCVETAPDRAAVMRYDLDGRGGRLYARGLRNAVGMALHPVTNEIWVSQHERDNIPPDHENLPPEEINVLRDGGDYGWPYCHSDRVPNPEYRDQARCDVTIAPALQMQAHSAPLGMTFLTGATHFPAEMRGDLLLAFHGSWNRDVPTGAKVMRIRVANDRPVSYEDFVWGFQRPDGSRWGRPTDVAVWRDGSVLVSEDLGGGIYRVSR